MKTRKIALFLAVLLTVGALQPSALAVERDAPQVYADYSESAVYAAMIAMADQYPEGMPWTNSNSYTSKGRLEGYIIYTGYGCAGFALILSDAAFGSLPIHQIDDFTYADVRVGDILRINGDTHSVIVLEKYADHVVIAEGNYNSSIHWGRTLTASQVEYGNYILTRYPDETTPEEPTEPENPTEPEEPTEPETPTEPEHQHSLIHIAAQAATCTEEGLQEHWYCTDCGKYFTDASATVEIEASALPVPALGHNFVNGFCTRCGYADPDAPQDTAVSRFLDVRSDAYYCEAVNWAVNTGITDGTGNGLFSPNVPCTRAQAVTFLWRAAGSPTVGRYITFSDVPSGSYYENAVAWALQAGITSGIGGGKFGPNETCTRGQIVTFLYRAAGRPGINVFAPGFSDVPGGEFYHDAAQWASDKGVTTGTGNGRFSPNDSCTRAQIVTFLYRYASVQ